MVLAPPTPAFSSSSKKPPSAAPGVPSPSAGEDGMDESAAMMPQLEPPL